MADDAPPTLDDFRALLGAARVFEASTRPEWPGTAWLGVDAKGVVVAIFAGLRIESGYHSAMGMMPLLYEAATAVNEAVVDASREADSRRVRHGWPPDAGAIEATITPRMRAAVASAIDALAGAIEAAEAVERLSPEARAALEAAARKKPGRTTHRDQTLEIVRRRAGGEKSSAVARSLRLSTKAVDSRYARWRDRLDELESPESPD